MKEENLKNELRRAAAMLGRLGGMCKGGRKAEVARKNGLKGGRPKKATVLPARRTGVS